MKKIIIILCILFACSLTTQAKARIPIIYSNGQKVSKILDLPKDIEIIASDGKTYHADLGVLYEQFSLFYIPLFNYGDSKYVLYTDTKIDGYDFTYIELKPSEIKILQEEYKYDIPTTLTIPFWDRMGGKLLVLAIFLAMIIFGAIKGDKESEVTQK